MNGEVNKKMKKVTVIAKIAVHPIQASIITGLQKGKISLENDSLREIADKTGLTKSPQQIQHHLNALLKLGFIQRIYDQFVYLK